MKWDAGVRKPKEKIRSTTVCQCYKFLLWLESWILFAVVLSSIVGTDVSEESVATTFSKVEKEISFQSKNHIGMN